MRLSRASYEDKENSGQNPEKTQGLKSEWREGHPLVAQQVAAWRGERLLIGLKEGPERDFGRMTSWNVRGTVVRLRGGILSGEGKG